MKLIKGTFLQFIMRNGLTSLIPLFQASTTFQGYGHLDEVAALYGLMWNTPNFINGFKERLAGLGFGGMLLHFIIVYYYLSSSIQLIFY